MEALKIGVIGHAEHVTIGRVAELPRAGEIVHLEGPEVLVGGGGGIAFSQLTKSDAEVHLFTAIGADDAGAWVLEQVSKSGAIVHTARRETAHTRDVVMVDPAGERTIVVVGPPLHPLASDGLPWELLAALDAVYFTAEDPLLLALARRARRLLVTARRRRAILGAGVEADLIVGSANDRREASSRSDYPVPPRALVMTEGAAGGRVETSEGSARFAAPLVEAVTGGAYGAGDSFAGALTYFIASGLPPLEAAGRAAAYGAAVLQSVNPLLAQARLTSVR